MQPRGWIRRKRGRNSRTRLTPRGILSWTDNGEERMVGDAPRPNEAARPRGAKEKKREML